MISADKIKSVREGLGETQSQFAARFGVDQSTLHRWETSGPPEKGASRKLLEQVIPQIEGQAA